MLDGLEHCPKGLDLMQSRGARKGRRLSPQAHVVPGGISRGPRAAGASAHKTSGSYAPGSGDGAFLPSLSISAPHCGTSYTNSSPDPCPGSCPGRRVAAPFAVFFAALRGRGKRAQFPPAGRGSVSSRAECEMRWVRGKEQGHAPAAAFTREVAQPRPAGPAAAGPPAFHGPVSSGNAASDREKASGSASGTKCRT